MDYTISQKLKPATLKSEYGVQRPDLVKDSAESRKVRNISGLVGVAITGAIGLASYYGLRALRASDNVAKFGAVVISLAPGSCGCCTFFYFQAQVSGDRKRVKEGQQMWAFAGAILGDPKRTFAVTWQNQLEEVKKVDSLPDDSGIYGLLRGDVEKMVIHLDGWKTTLDGMDSSSQQNKEAAKPVVQKMASQVSTYFAALQTMREFSDNSSKLGKFAATTRVNTYQAMKASLLVNKQTFMALETLLRKGTVQTTKTLIANDVDLDSSATTDYALPL